MHVHFPARGADAPAGPAAAQRFVRESDTGDADWEHGCERSQGQMD